MVRYGLSANFISPSLKFHAYFQWLVICIASNIQLFENNCWIIKLKFICFVDYLYSVWNAEWVPAVQRHRWARLLVFARPWRDTFALVLVINYGSLFQFGIFGILWKHLRYCNVYVWNLLKVVTIVTLFHIFSYTLSWGG